MSYCDTCIQFGNDINNPVKHAPEDCPHAAAVRRDRARIRRELEVALARPAGSSAVYSRREIVEALDRVCPLGKEG